MIRNGLNPLIKDFTLISFMKILHLSFHYGCISDLNYVFTKLEHHITHHFVKDQIPYHITESIARSIWQKNKDHYNSYDMIITSDTVALSYIFLLHLHELKPFLVILNCNRFNYGMDSERRFLQLLQEVQSHGRYVERVMYLPYTDFERIWCGKHHIFLHERSVMPMGHYEHHINDANLILECFKPTQTEYRTKELSETIFLQNYHNHYAFMNLSKFLYDHQISVDFGSYSQLDELLAYKAIVVLPDQFSKYFTFESIQKELVVVMPSPKFLMELVKKPGYYFNVEGSSGKLTPEYINLCEWCKYPETRIYFDSFDEMIRILQHLDKPTLESKKEWCRFYRNVIHTEHLLQWKHICDRIEFHRKISHQE